MRDVWCLKPLTLANLCIACFAIGISLPALMRGGSFPAFIAFLLGLVNLAMALPGFAESMRRYRAVEVDGPAAATGRADVTAV